MKLDTAFAALVALAGLAASGAASPAGAQGTINDLIAARNRPASGSERLLVEGREIVYDTNRNTVAASGDVELNYGGRTLQADRVTYDRTTGRVFAEGNVRLTDSNGTVTTGSRFELTDDFKTGFIDSLRVAQPTRDAHGPVTVRFAAPRGERVDGETTTFIRGTYTPYPPDRVDPERPPLWRVKAGRIVHNNSERTIYYEDSALEFAGVPIAYIPYFWAPDPSVRRLSGFLAPTYIHTNALGLGVGIPYYWAIAPDKDLTVQPTFYTRQGVLMQGEYRQRFLTGSVRIRAAGIFQQDGTPFLPSPFGPRERDGRGVIESQARFNINERWTTGWNVALLSDKWVLQNYKLRSNTLASSFLLLESTSQVYLQGQGDRSFFDLRGFYFKGLSFADWQKQLPLVAPVLDYEKRIDAPQPLGGEVKFGFNFTNVNRSAAQFEPVSVFNRAFPFSTATTDIPYESCIAFQRGTCLVRGLPGNYARASVDVSWRRNIVDDAGQVWTPFAYLRADGFFNSPDATGFQNPQIANFVNPSDDTVVRAMPAVGVEYRYPFVADAGRYGTHTLTPIGQIVARPNESHIGRLPNEDAHSLVYDDTNLFRWDKFSGYDRVEGGVRANLGLRYDIQTPAGWTGNAVVGQSYQVTGRNSYAAADLINTGQQSGLDNRVSDVVGRVQLNPHENYSLVVRSRLDHKTFDVNAFEAQAVANLKPYLPLTTSLSYVRYAAQPAIGYIHRREGLQPAAAFQITPNWSVGGSVLFDLDRYLDNRDTFLQAYQANLARGGQALANGTVYNRGDLYTVSQAAFSLGYKDEGTVVSLNYAVTPRVAATGERDSDRTVLLKVELRTLGQVAFSQNLGTAATTDGLTTR